MINDLLKNLDFGDKEIEVYLAILKHGKVIPADLAKITGINRSTVYSIAEELCRKGVINQDLSGAIKFFLPAQPEELENVIKQEEKRLAQKKAWVAKAVNELKAYSANTQYAIPKLRFIMEDELDRYFYKQNDKWEKSAFETDPCWYGFQDHTFVENFYEYINWYWSRPHNKMKLKMFSNKCDAENKIEKRHYANRKVKFFTKKFPFSSSIMIIGDYIIMVVCNQHPYYAIEIKNKELAKNLREVLKLFWSTA